MLTFLAVLHVIIGLGLIGFVLLQDPKGGGAGGMFGGGGSSNSLFGSTGAGNFLTATTKWFAICFAVSCLALSCVSTTNQKKGSVLDSGEMAAPAVPETPNQPALPAPETAPAAPAPGTETPKPVTPPPAGQ